MPIPALNAHGLLPKGIHDCTMAELAALFSSSNSRHKRARLFKSLDSFIAWIRPVECFRYVYVDGSYVTNKEIPGDIDLVLELPAPNLELLARIKKMKLSNQNYVHERFGIHVFLFAQDFSENDLRAFFQYLRPEEALTRGLPAGSTKGILRLSL